MNTHRQTLFQAVLARISFGAVPVDGTYWFDPKDAGIAHAETLKSRKRCEVPEADWSPVSMSPWLRALRRP
jgi:hypothetical protein